MGFRHSNCLQNIDILLPIHGAIFMFARTILYAIVNGQIRVES